MSENIIQPDMCMCFWCNEDVLLQNNKDKADSYYYCNKHEYVIQFIPGITTEGVVFNSVVNVHLTKNLVISFNSIKNKTSIWHRSHHLAFWQMEDQLLPNDFLLRDLDSINTKIRTLLPFL